MAVWNPFVTTNLGLSALITAAASGAEINVTRMTTSTHNFKNEILTNLQALPNEKQSFAVLGVTKIADDKVKIESVMNNVGLTENYPVRALGIYAKMGSGDEFLLGVITAVTPDTMPANASGVVKTITYKILMTLSNASSVGVSVDLNAYVTRSMCIDISHPVGTIVITDGSYNPADKFGGEWKQITGKYLMASGTYNGKAYKAGDIAGETAHKFLYDEMPMHSHTRGTMEIEGSFWADDSQYGSWYGPLEGAFHQGRKTGKGDLDSSGGGYASGQIEFIASRNWTGATSVEGKSNPMPLMPYCLVVDVWKRIG